MTPQDLNKEAIAIVTLALGSVPGIASGEAAAAVAYRAEVLGITRELEPDDVALLTATIGMNSAALLIWLADEINASPEDILQTIALANSEE